MERIACVVREIENGNTDLRPVTVAERSKAYTVFALSEAGVVVSNPTQDRYV
jgi:hypothetical protein